MKVPVDHDFGVSCDGVSSVCLGEATWSIGGASDGVFQNGSFGLSWIEICS